MVIVVKVYATGTDRENGINVLETVEVTSAKALAGVISDHPFPARYFAFTKKDTGTRVGYSRATLLLNSESA